MSNHLLLETLQWLDSLDYGTEDAEDRKENTQEQQQVEKSFESIRATSSVTYQISSAGAKFHSPIRQVDKDVSTLNLSKTSVATNTTPQRKSHKNTLIQTNTPKRKEHRYQYLDYPISGYDYDSEPDDQLFRSSSLKYNFHKWRKWLNHCQTNPDKSILREKIMTSEHILFVRIPAWRSYLLTLKGFHKWLHFSQQRQHNRQFLEEYNPSRLQLRYQLKLSLHFWRVWYLHRFYQRKHYFRQWRRRQDSFQPLKQMMKVLKRLLIFNHFKVWKRRSKWPKVAIHRNNFTKRVVFRRLKNFCSVNQSRQERKRWGVTHYLNRFYQRWRKHYLIYKRFRLMPLHTRTAKKSPTTNSYHQRIVQTHFTEFKKGIFSLKLSRDRFQIARQYYHYCHFHAALEIWKYYCQMQTKFLPLSREKKLLQSFKKKKFLLLLSRIKQSKKQYVVYQKSKRFYLKRKFQHFKKQVFFYTISYQEWVKRLYYQQTVRRIMQKHLLPYFHERIHSKQLYHKGYQHWLWKESVSFFIRIRQRRAKKMQLLNMILFYQTSKVLVRWRDFTEQRITEKISLRRSELRFSIRKQSAYIKNWFITIQKKMKLRQRFFYYQQLKKVSYFTSPISVAFSNQFNHYDYDHSTALSYPTSNVIYKVRVQQLQTYFHAWKIEYRSYYHRISTRLKQFQWKYQIELQQIIFNYWFDRYERKIVWKRRLQIGFRRWKVKTRRTMMLLHHWSDIIKWQQKKQKLQIFSLSSYISVNRFPFTLPRLQLPVPIIHQICDHLTAFPEFLWYQILKTSNMKEETNRSLIKVNRTLQQSSNQRAFVSVSKTSSTLPEFRLYQMSLCRSFLHYWYIRYLQKTLYYQAKIPTIHRQLINHIPRYPEIELQIIQRQLYHRQRQYFRLWQHRYNMIEATILQVQRKLFMKPLFYHWIRLYNYYTMKKILQLPSVFEKSVTVHTLPARLIHDKRMLSQHLSQLKQKISNRHSGSMERSVAKAQPRIRKLKGSATESIDDNRNRSTAKLIGDLSYTEKYRSPDSATQTAIALNTQPRRAKKATGSFLDRKNERALNLSRNERLPKGQQSESGLDSTIATLDSHRHHYHHRLQPSDNSRSDELQNTTTLIHPSQSYLQQTHHHSLLHETILEENEKEEENDLSDDSLGEGSTLSASSYHPSAVDDEHRQQLSSSQDRIDFHYTYQQFLQQRSYLGKYEFMQQAKH